MISEDYLIKKEGYRQDIDGLRAIAVLAVFVFHAGYLPNGYLGVDVFFVISGYLITKIIYIESLKGKFKILNFYFQRIQFDSKYREINKKLDEEWTDRFIDLTELIIDEEGTLPVFTSDCKFISQDGKHLTKFGAQYLSSLYLPEIDQIFNKMESNNGVK